MKPLFYQFGKNLKDSFFKGPNLIYYLLAVLCTYIIVTSDFDWTYFNFFADTNLSHVLFSAAVVGGFGAIIIPIIVLLIGKVRKSVKLLNTGFALGQAALIGFLITTFIKIFTGRVPPPLNHLNGTIIDLTPLSHITSPLLDISRDFQFGLFRGGIFWGWPSSHTAIAVAMAFTLLTLYAKNKTVKTLAIIYALYIGFGVSITIHWFSDFVAGALIGLAIGTVVGQAFKERENSL